MTMFDRNYVRTNEIFATRFGPVRILAFGRRFSKAQTQCRGIAARFPAAGPLHIVAPVRSTSRFMSDQTGASFKNMSLTVSGRSA